MNQFRREIRLITILIQKSGLFLVILLSTHQLVAQPVIDSFSPASGIAGSTITIAGNHFSDTANKNIVFFGAVQANVSDAANNMLMVTVPAGLSSQPVTVTVNGLTGFSNEPFSLTIPESGFLDTNLFQKTDYPTTWGAVKLYSTDFDGDGRPDIVTEEWGATMIYRNTGSAGTLSLSLVKAVPRANAISVGDIDGDGKPDIITAAGSILSVSRNTSSTGNISFAPEATFPISGSPTHIAIEDLDGDGKPDLAITNVDPNGFLSIVRNLSVIGNISLASEVIYHKGYGYSPMSVAIADVDGDGKPDVIVPASAVDTVFIYRNVSSPGNISLDTTTEYPTGDGPMSVATGDLDGDGKTDFVLTDFNRDSISVFKNKSVTGDISFSDKIDYAAGSNPVWVSIGDLNGDGKPDLAIANESYNGSTNPSVSFYQNNSRNNILSFVSKLDYATGAVVKCLSICDMDGDGKYELVAGIGLNMTVIRFQIVPIASPHIISFTPKAATSGDTVTITGTNFSTSTEISFGGTASHSFTIVSDTLVRAVIETGSSGSVKLTTSAGIDSIGGFTFLQKPNLQPFALIQFAATMNGSAVQLEWETTNEKNISHYVLESCGDSISFIPVGEIVPLRDTGVNHYIYPDAPLKYKVNYYRLKIFDTAGEISVSNIVIIESQTNLQSIKIYPNPAIGFVLINHPVISSTAEIKLMDFMGRLVNIFPVEPNSSQSRINFSISLKGLYRIVWTDGTKTTSQTLLIVP